jgi:predicted  nucleic acid-binding Zn-ribbon protein
MLSISIEILRREFTDALRAVERQRGYLESLKSDVRHHEIELAKAQIRVDALRYDLGTNATEVERQFVKKRVEDAEKEAAAIALLNAVRDFTREA